MRELILNAASWQNRDSIYDSFFEAVGSPSWHGRNFDALRDSICTGSINTIEVPYILVVYGYSEMSPYAKQAADDLIDLIRDLQKSGCAVSIRLD